MNQISWDQLNTDRINVDPTTLDHVRAAGMGSFSSTVAGLAGTAIALGLGLVVFPLFMEGVVGPLVGPIADKFFSLGAPKGFIIKPRKRSKRSRN